MAYTKLKIEKNNSVRFKTKKGLLDFEGDKMPILIIVNYQIAIRPCELTAFSKIFGKNYSINSSTKSYIRLMNFMTNNRLTLLDILQFNDFDFKNFEEVIFSRKNENLAIIVNDLRDFLKQNKEGINIIKYLLNKPYYSEIEDQLFSFPCFYLSNLFLQNGSIPFDKMPYAFSLVKHNCNIFNLIQCIDFKNRKHELLAREINRIATEDNVLFSSEEDLYEFENIDELIKDYNDNLYIGHKDTDCYSKIMEDINNDKIEYKNQDLRILKIGNNLYINQYIIDTAVIFNVLKKYSNIKNPAYSLSIEKWISQNFAYANAYSDKIQILKKLFANSNIAFISGAAGTGKTTLMDLISNAYNLDKKMFISVTHTAVENMERRITSLKSNCRFFTVEHIKKSHNYIYKTNILFIDECSTLSNKDMVEILKRVRFNKIVLVGDEYQIESINYGNWFLLAKKFMKKNCYELLNTYRTTNIDLEKLWNSVRNLENNITEYMIKLSCSKDIKSFDFTHNNDEIVLCLNYDGFYGINNINRILQNKNSNEAFEWNLVTYKIGDPILFDDSNSLGKLIYNNLKGVIYDIIKEENLITFQIEVNEIISPTDSEIKNFKVLKYDLENEKSIIEFSVSKIGDTDNEDDLIKASVPFQIAYAISIHKAQGLEYNSVKIIIPYEVEERITKNIFYTAITRAKESLKIYWTPEVENEVLKSFKDKNYDKDFYILKQMNLW